MILKDIGNNVNIEKGASFSPEITIKDNSNIGINALIKGEVHIGKDVMMGPNCIVHTRNHTHSSVKQPMMKQGFQDTKPVIISDDVWIGSNVIILPGSKIGTGTILGTGAVIRGNIPDYAIAIGNPAQVIKIRN